LQLSILYAESELQKTMPHNSRTEVAHQNKRASKAGFRLKL